MEVDEAARPGVIAGPDDLGPQEVDPNRRRVPIGVWVFALYLVLGLVTIGRHAIGHPSTVCACVGASDPAAYMWALSWWPHAILHGLNPFVTHYQWAPTGANVAQGAMIPTAALAMAPLTALAGPIASYNALALLSVVLSAFTAYLLCRRLVGREAPAVVGGFVFGFSAYNFGQLTGHLNLTLIFLLPVMLHLGVRRWQAELSARTYIALGAAVLLLQTGLSTELLVDAVGLGAILLVATRLFIGAEERPRLDRLVLETIGAGVVALVIGAPFFYYALFSGGLPKGAGFWTAYAMDLLNPLFPTEATLLGHQQFHALTESFGGGGVTGQGGYLGVPLLVAFVAWGVSGERKKLLTKLAVIAAIVSFVLALGARLHVAGHETVALPGSWLQNLPIANNIIPERFSVFTSLAVAIGISAWIARPGGSTAVRVARWFVVVLVLVTLWPNIPRSLYGVPPANPRFYATDMYRRYLTRGETDLILPFSYNDVSTLWQAETGFYFYMSEGYLGQVAPSAFASEVVSQQLLANVPPSAPALDAFIRQHHVSHVVVDPVVQSTWLEVLAAAGLHSEHVGGVILYRVPEDVSGVSRSRAAGSHHEAA